MKAQDVLVLQLKGSFSLLTDLVDNMTDEEWTGRKVPHASKPGFVVWHCGRIIDWGIHCAIQGVPEIAMKPEWSGLRAADFAYGAGITDAEADEAAASVSRPIVRRYLGAVQPIAVAWLERQEDSDLERVPNLKANQSSNERYLSAPVWAEVASLEGVPTWQVLGRTSISHIRVHCGEVRTLLHELRAEGPA